MRLVLPCSPPAREFPGSGSTYIYGFCDAYYQPGMNRQQCEEFVKKGAPDHHARRRPLSLFCLLVMLCPAALCHAMARDGSSGGVIRTVAIDGSGVERKMVPGNKLPYGPI